MFPLWIFIAILLFGVAGLVLVRNTRKLRDEFGKDAAQEQIRQKYPKAKIFPLVKK